MKCCHKRADVWYHSHPVASDHAHFVQARDEVGNTPLTAAAARGFYECVVLLLDQGANIHYQNRRAEGGSALHEAVARRHDRIVDLLLRRGASPFTENAKGGWLCLHIEGGEAKTSPSRPHCPEPPALLSFR